MEKIKRNKDKESEEKIIKDNNFNKNSPQIIFDKEKLDLSANKINQSEEINDNEIIFDYMNLAKQTLA